MIFELELGSIPRDEIREAEYLIYEFLQSDGSSFYIGRTRHFERFRLHLRAAQCYSNRPVSIKIRELHSKEEKIFVRIVHQTDDLDEAKAIERLFIHARKDDGIVNTCWVVSTPLSLEHRAAISRTLIGRSLSNEHRTSISRGLTGRSCSLECREAISRAKKGKGKPWSEKRRAAYEKGRKSRSSAGLTVYFDLNRDDIQSDQAVDRTTDELKGDDLHG